MNFAKEEKTYSIAACILAGGRSKRMGCPKESVVIHGDGRTFLDRICDETDKAYPSIITGRFLSIRNDRKINRTGYTIVTDRFGDVGPIGGIASVLTEAKKIGFDAVLMLACDLISYDHQEIVKICEHYDGEDILFARTGKEDIQPLASIYGVNALDAMIAQIKNSDYRIRDLIDSIDKIGYYDADQTGYYINQNTPL